MMVLQEGQLLRIFIGESDQFEGGPLFEWLVNKARDCGLAGATVIRGLEVGHTRGRHDSVVPHNQGRRSVSDQATVSSAYRPFPWCSICLRVGTIAGNTHWRAA